MIVATAVANPVSRESERHEIFDHHPNNEILHFHRFEDKENMSSIARKRLAQDGVWRRRASLPALFVVFSCICVLMNFPQQAEGAASEPLLGGEYVPTTDVGYM